MSVFGESTWVRQVRASDCGAACLATVLRCLGRFVTLEELRSELGYGRDGMSAARLVEASARFGLTAQGVSVELEDLGGLDVPAILHWEFRHFVVLLDVDGADATIFDPASGRRRVRAEELSKKFTGVALVFEASASFERRGRARSLLRSTVSLLAGARFLGRAFGLSLALQVLAIGAPLLSGALIDRGIGHRAIGWLTVASLAFGAYGVAHFFASLVRGHVLAELRGRLDLAMTTRFLRHLLALPMRFFTGRSNGDLMARLDSLSSIRELATASVLSALIDGGLAALYLLVILSTNRTIFASVLGLGALRIAVVLLTASKQRELIAESAHLQARLTGYQAELLNGVELVKVTANEAAALRRYEQRYTEQLNAALARGRLEATTEAVLSLLAVVSPLVVLMIGVALVTRVELTLGQLLALSAMAAGFLAPLGSLASTAIKLLSLSVHVERVEEVLDATIERQGGRTFDGALRGELELRSVGFAYDQSAELVLRDVSVRVPAGAKVAIVGRSGAGKSTLARLLTGLYGPTFGDVLVDGVPLGDLDLAAYRRRVGVVTQTTQLFAGSIRDNIAFGHSEATLDEVIAAAKSAGVHEEIASMPLGYDTPLGDAGAGLSGGQAQRIALARALLPKPRILLLDEASSSLDALTEIAIFEALRTMACTRVVVAHRLSTVRDADLILVLEQGRVVQAGRHEELLAKRGSYEALIRAQLASQGGDC